MAKRQRPSLVPNAGPVALPTRIDDAEQAYLTTLMKQHEAAQAAINMFGGYLSQKYQLQNGDSVTPDGKIVRKPSA